MRNPNRIPDFCNRLAAVWSKNPDWRFGQLIENIKKEYNLEDLFYIEDDEFLARIEESEYNKEVELPWWAQLFNPEIFKGVRNGEE